jgi:hypothetical protein
VQVQQEPSQHDGDLYRRAARAAKRRAKALAKADASQQELGRQDYALAEILHKIYPTVSVFDFVISQYHECAKSPVGMCIYDNLNDSMLDDCLICHQPEVRK